MLSLKCMRDTRQSYQDSVPYVSIKLRLSAREEERIKDSIYLFIFMGGIWTFFYAQGKNQQKVGG